MTATPSGWHPAAQPPTARSAASNYTLYALPDTISLGEGPSGPACGQTAATECILYIGNDQDDFTQPHLWSAPFYIAPDDWRRPGRQPGDGSAPAVATAVPDATNSTVVALTDDGHGRRRRPVDA